MFHFFHHPISHLPLPERFTDPFHYTPHPLCMLAAQEVQTYLSKLELWEKHPEEGKMFGVLAVSDPEGKIGFLAAFSGILAGSYLHPYFVPPVYNLQEPSGFFQQEERYISALNGHIRQMENHPDYLAAQERLKRVAAEAQKALAQAKEALKTAKAARDRLRKQSDPPCPEERLIRESQRQKADYKRLEQQWKKEILREKSRTDDFSRRILLLKNERKQRSAALQQRLFQEFRFLNARGEVQNLCDIFRQTVHKAPPAGAGECAAPKLLQYAYLHHFHPLAMAEFWWGCPPKTEIRRQGCYYPACKGKCEPILKHMLQGLEIEPPLPHARNFQELFPEIVYEDEWLLVINKPEGLLSVPGKTGELSVCDLARKRYPEASGPLIVHRLDMATSGLLLIAKHKAVHALLQRQFLQRSITKKYIALLDGKVTTDAGCINLPLCPDPHDRPRQIVSQQSGKPALTRYQVLVRQAGRTRIAFYPQTGRTHQLRVHAAHPLGLNCPIAGDSLYGTKAARLYLHAESLEFVHPVSGQNMRVEKKADF